MWIMSDRWRTIKMLDLASYKLQLQLKQKHDLQMSELKRITSHCTTKAAAVTGPHLCCWI